MSELQTKRAEVVTHSVLDVNNGHNGVSRSNGNGFPASSSAREDQADEVPEVFQMPPTPTTRIRARIRHVGPAPFVFVDELTE